MFVAALIVAMLCWSQVRVPQQPRRENDELTLLAQSQFIGKVKFESMSIRVLILRHTWDNISFTDTKQAISAVNVAASKGLTIKEIGDFNIDKDGLDKRVKFEAIAYEELTEFIDEQMKIGAEAGDTLVIYTIGHGGGGGGLQTLGQRKDIMNIFAELAAKNQQETFWWQLSCHAAAKLPDISTLTEEEQDYFSMIASSPSNQLSYFCTQGEQMQKVFTALAEKSPKIDPNGDEIVTAGELKQFLNEAVPSGSFPSGRRGDLLFARSDDEPIFGAIGLARRIPIIDRDNPQGEYERDYIAIPSRKYK